MTANHRPVVLVVEDEADLRALIEESLVAQGFDVQLADTGAQALERLSGYAFDAVVIDWRLPDIVGLAVLDAGLDRYPDLVAVMMTGVGGVAEAVAAMRRGAVDFLIKPFQLSQLARVLQNSLDKRRLRQENAELRAQLHERYRFDTIVGQSPAIRQVFNVLELIAPRNSTVLIHGETGTGKELIARTIHHNSPRADQRFVAFSSAAIPEGLVEAELFGHTRGAFTGAVASRVGRFELAHRGTIFIDEVGMMPLPLQAKLLRALQEREIERVGESRSIKFDARIIAATNCDLRKLVKEGAFREDLFYRLNVIPITLPPLRDRREDIPLLVRHFVQKSCKSNGTASKTMSQFAMRRLMAHSWPGNIRQLENAIEHAVAMSGTEKEIPESALPEEILSPGTRQVVPLMTIPDEGINFTSVVSQVERELILKCLEKTGGNKRQAARLLNLSRTTLIDKLHRLNLLQDSSAA
ncbi:MAG: sigma-54-dependent Fis family transcriptional regulator [Acidobacteria bacterium]|nr:sigma-54-dependent Fis family transcriptional regulator [Acidobacteriota bacterium]